MSEFRPRVSPSAAPARQPRRALWIVATIFALAATGLLVSTGDEPPGPAAESGAASSVSNPPVADDHPIAALPPPEPYRPDPAGRVLLRELKLEPRRGAGYVVTPRDAELLAHTPLREGDVLLEIDGRKLDPATVATLADELGEFDDVWVGFERNGKKQETLLELRRR